MQSDVNFPLVLCKPSSQIIQPKFNQCKRFVLHPHFPFIYLTVSILGSSTIFGLSFKYTLRFVPSTSNATKRVTYNSLGKIVGIRHPETIKNYLEYIQQTYMIFQLLKYAPSVKTQMLSPKKVYFIDNAIISRMGFNVTDNNGVKLENAVFIELLRRGCDLFYHADKKECDFVVREGVRITQAYQVTVKMDDEKTRKREIEGLQEAMEIYDLSEGYIITLNEKEELTVDGKAVHIIPAWEWMLK